jgi:SAM-dependent methyltransferase
MSEPNLLPLLYDSEATAGWHAGMAAVTRALLPGVRLPVAPRVLEVGCGNGELLRLLATDLPDARLAGMDLSPVALRSAAEKGSSEGAAVALTQANLLRLPFANQSFDALLALDSFDQSAIDIDAALAEAWRVLRPGGFLLLRVSAYPWLYGPHDRAFNTGRRYAASEVRAALAASGFAVLHLTHANSLLAPPVVALRLLSRMANELRSRGILPRPKQAAGGSSGVYASPVANRAVELALRAEAAWLRVAPLPAGLSLIALACKVTP